MVTVSKTFLDKLVTESKIPNLEIRMFSTVEDKAIGEDATHVYYIEYVIQLGEVYIVDVVSYDKEVNIDTVLQHFRQFRK